jgi:uncharacterized protein (DUF488 family)
MTIIYTIGHGNRPIGEFVALLREAGIGCLVDVRAYPASRRHPQFAREALERSLIEAGIRYVWEGVSLGGRRQAVVNSPHLALKEPAFRAYADHMGTPPFREGAARLISLGSESRVAVMCAERLPSECHRSFISDYLVAGGRQVSHLVETGALEDHRLNSAARLRDGRLVYDGATQCELGL